MTISEKLAKIKENEQKIYDGAREQGLVEGTSDATATEGCMLSGCTAYVKGKKIEGTITTQPAAGVFVRDGYAYIYAGYYPDDALLSDTKLVPEIIKNGESIFGVVGTYEGSLENEASIHAALENLLTVQESYLPEILSFTFEDANGVTCSLEFEKGMMWGEWCESFYNTVGMYINTDEESQVLYWGVSAVVKLIDPENEITASELIEAERTYKAV